MTTEYAVSVMQFGVSATVKFEAETMDKLLGELAELLESQAIVRRIADNGQALVIKPGPGTMFFVLCTWEQHVKTQQAARAAKAGIVPIRGTPPQLPILPRK